MPHRCSQTQEATPNLSVTLAAVLLFSLASLLAPGCPETDTTPDTAVATDTGDAQAVDVANTDTDPPDGSVAVDVTDKDTTPDVADVPLAPVAPLRVATWNIEKFPKSSKTLTRVAGLVKSLDFDVLAIQEIADVVAFEGLVAALPGYEGVVNDDDGNWLRVGLIYKTSRVSMAWSATEFQNDGWAFPRPPLIASLAALREDGSTAFDFIAVVLHLKAQIDPESEGRRREACQKLDNWLGQQMAFGTERDYVLLGDWNDSISDSADKNVFSALLDKTDNYAFLTSAAAQAGDISYLPFPGLIDHIMITEDALDELNGGVTQVLRLEQTEANYEFEVSDHLPVVTTFELR